MGPRFTSRFKRDFQRVVRRGRNPEALWPVVGSILAGEKLAARHRPHRLSGQWRGHWECHIEPDWLLIWTHQEGVLVLVRTGTHADLFG